MGEDKYFIIETDVWNESNIYVVIGKIRVRCLK